MNLNCIKITTLNEKFTRGPPNLMIEQTGLRAPCRTAREGEEFLSEVGC